jgi:hypothetical protein
VSSKFDQQSLSHVTTGIRSGWIGERSKKLYRRTMEMEQVMERLLAEINEINGDV